MVRLVLLSLMLGGSAHAMSKSERDAERQRLHEQLSTLSERGHWSGADDVYRRMVELRGVELTLDDHLRGIEAAEALGAPTDVWNRVHAAMEIELSDAVLERYARLSALYGEVEIKVPKSFEGSATLTVAHMPLDPAQRQVIESAQEALATEGSYRGLLPLGQYRAGEQPFDIVGAEVFTVVAR